MAEVIRPAGGLPSATKKLLIPENIRSGVHIKGGGVDVIGTVEPQEVSGLVFAGYGETDNESGQSVAINNGTFLGSPFFRVDSAYQVTCLKACDIRICFTYWRISGAGFSGTLTIYRSGVAIANVYTNTGAWAGYTSPSTHFEPGQTITLRTTGQNANYHESNCYAYIG